MRTGFRKQSVATSNNPNHAGIDYTGLETEAGALCHLHSVKLWKLNDFRLWVEIALLTIRELRKTLMNLETLNGGQQLLES